MTTRLSLPGVPENPIPSPDFVGVRLGHSGKYQCWLWLPLFFSTGIFSSGHWVVPALAWIGPFFALRFIAAQPGWLGGFGLVSAGFLGFLISQRGIIPMADGEFAIVALVATVLGFLPYWIYRRLARRFQSFALTLAFPAMVVALEHLFAQGGFGTWGSQAITQYRNTTFIQLASLAGTSGIVFLMNWVVAVVDWSWSRAFSREETGRPLIGMLSVLAGVILFGQFRILILGQFVEQVRVAGIIVNESPFRDPAIRTLTKSFRDQSEIAPEARNNFLKSFRRRKSDLMTQSTKAAEVGARLIYWSEGSLVLTLEEESSLIAEGLEFAAAHNVHLGMAIVTLRKTGEPAFMENKIILAYPDGKTTNTYFKSLIPPGEPSIGGNSRPPGIKTDSGTISHVICFDTDFPELMRQPARNQTCLVLAPSNDWPAAAEPHLAVASLRAVESGYSLVRITSNGISVVVDPVGRLVYESNSLYTTAPFFLADVPLGRVLTLYALVGDLFAITCCLGSAIVVLISFLPRKWVARERLGNGLSEENMVWG